MDVPIDDYEASPRSEIHQRTNNTLDVCAGIRLLEARFLALKVESDIGHADCRIRVNRPHTRQSTLDTAKSLGIREQRGKRLSRAAGERRATTRTPEKATPMNGVNSGLQGRCKIGPESKHSGV